MLTYKEINSRFEAVKQEVDLRWKRFVSHLSFPSYRMTWSEKEVVEEYYWMHGIRKRYWQDSLFQSSKEIVAKRRFREPDCITFAHSATDETYNSTCISAGKRRFFALEGPQPHHADRFLSLLDEWSVASLVCLTNATEPDGREKCYPYWKNRTSGADPTLFLKTKKREIPYLNWPDWIDNHGTCPIKLSTRVRQMCARFPEREIMAVHCSAGVGRTGTFISAICLNDQVEEQKAAGKSADQIQISVPKLLLYLNLFRPRLVCNADQYLTLYQTIDQLIRY